MIDAETIQDLNDRPSEELREIIAHAAGIHAHRDGDNGGTIAVTLYNIADRVSLKPRLRSELVCVGQATLRQVMADTFELTGVTPKEILSSSRTKRVARARQRVMWVLREAGIYSLSQIGHALGGKDHTTVLHGVRVHAARMGLEAAE